MSMGRTSTEEALHCPATRTARISSNRGSGHLQEVNYRMIQAMYNGVSGLRAHKTMMDVISNNIANVNTVGYKSARVSFREAFSQTMKGASAPMAGGAGGTNPMQLGLGAAIGSIDISQNQGSLQPTGKLTDMAIEGNGFFIITDGAAQYYSRDGSFSIDQAGNLVSTASGFKVLGWMADPQTGLIDSSAPIGPATTIKMPVGQLARPTSELVYGGNLDMRTVPGDSRAVSAVVYDSLGMAHTLSLNFIKEQNPMVSQGYASATSTVGEGSMKVTLGAGTADEVSYDINVAAGTTLTGLAAAINAAGGGSMISASVMSDGPSSAPCYLKMTSADGWQVTVDMSDLTGTGAPVFSATNSGWTWTASEGGIEVGGGTLVFDGSGKNPVSTGSINLNLQNGANSPLGINVDFGSITQLAGGTTVSATSQDGLPLGTLETFTIGRDGVISGVFTNGQTQPLGQIALAAFNNSAGLNKAGNNLLIESSNSGPAQIGRPASGSMGKVMGGFLESSNVDLPTEFANMIVAQRGFQANSRIITTSDEILMELVQLKR